MYRIALVLVHFKLQTMERRCLARTDRVPLSPLDVNQHSPAGRVDDLQIAELGAPRPVRV